MRLIEFKVIFQVPMPPDKMEVRECYTTFIAENITHFSGGRIPSNIVNKFGQPKEKRGTHIFVGRIMFMVEETYDDVKAILEDKPLLEISADN